MKKNIVVIDDEMAIRSILERQLSLYGFEFYGCETGEEGLECVMNLAKTTTVDVVLLDWMMPKMSGLEVLTKLKRRSLTCDIPVFMLTSKTKMDDLDEAFDNGADNYITKPFSVKSIGSTINLKLAKLQEKKDKLMGVR
ncbi:MAG: response regulator [Phycisphaeraceae bacterium]|nr:response regulator [Phycisphaeraceae bacterium]